MQEDKGTFFDSRTLTAIVLVGLVWFGWQSYLSKKYPNYGKPPVKTETADPSASGTAAPAAGTAEAAKVAEKTGLKASPSVTKVATEKIIHFENDKIAFDVSSRGMAIKNFVLKAITTRENQPVNFGQVGNGLYSLSLSTGEPLSFEVSQPAPNVFKGTASGVGGTQVVREMTLDTETLAITNNVQVTGAPAQYRTVRIQFSEPKHEPKASSFLMPSYDHQELLVKHGTKSERTNLSSLSENLEKSYSGATLGSLGSQYFATAMVDKSGLLPEILAKASTGKEPLQVEAVYSPTPATERLDLKFIAYAGPKSHDVLKAIDADLARVIDLGIFSSIGEVLLFVMQWFHKFVHNWGLAIILLTLLVRLIVLPFNMFSYKSMKKMQQIQPLMTSVRERYKDDPQTMQREVMGLMKEHKVNPLGGCLPMLLQMPVFFALYQVLGQSIELYKAPFFGWIHDLSLKDPFFVLPILMGAAMYVQQKITPSTMDPAQAKIMQFLPIVFALMMVSLPSGLTLYIFVSTVFGVVQQVMFMRDRHTTVAKPAKA